MSVIDNTELSAADAADEASITRLSVEQIRPAEDNPRGDLGDLTDLTNSIKSVGVLQPIVVTPRPEAGKAEFLCVIGHRRLAATIKAGRPMVPAIIREMDEPSRLAAMFIENAQREDLTPVEEARSLRSLGSLGLSQRDIAKRVGKSQAHISKRLSLLDLPPEVQAEVDTGALAVGDAVELARLKDDKQILDVIARTKRVLASTVTYEGVARVVGDVLAKAERAKNVARVTRQLRAEGVTVVDYPNGGAFTAKTGKRLGDGFGQVNVSAEAHATEPCHAAVVTPDAEVVYVCTESDRHKPAPGDDGEVVAPTGTPEEPRSDEDMQADRERAEFDAHRENDQRERARERAELDAAAERRQAFIADLLRGKPNKNDVLTHVLTDYITYNSYSPHVLAWLGIDTTDDEAEDDEFRDYAGQSLANLTRAALAVVLGDAEELLDRAGVAAFLGGEATLHFAFLVANGYEPSPIEQRGLDGPPTPTEEPVTEEPTEEPVTEEPTEEPVTEEPTEEEPGTEEPTEEPGTEEPSKPKRPRRKPIKAEPSERVEGEPTEGEPSEPVAEEGAA